MRESGVMSSRMVRGLLVGALIAVVALLSIATVASAQIAVAGAYWERVAEGDVLKHRVTHFEDDCDRNASYTIRVDWGDGSGLQPDGKIDGVRENITPGRCEFPVERSEEHTSELQSRQYLVCS